MEPEMVNPNSVLFHEHPDWVIRQPKRELELQRNQLVLDLTRPAVQEFEWNTIKSILSVPDITYAKWDCNRYLTQPGSPYLAPDRQSDLWIDYVQALYALMDKTAKTFPDTELMLCSGGGGRVDYGALKYFQEFWPSDNTDPTVRVLMQWDYSYFFPPMAMASHVTHWGNRPMHFACSVAMSARFRHGPRPHQIAGTGQGHLRRGHQRLQTNPGRDGIWRFVPAGRSAREISRRAGFCVTRTVRARWCSCFN